MYYSKVPVPAEIYREEVGFLCNYRKDSRLSTVLEPRRFIKEHAKGVIELKSHLLFYDPPNPSPANPPVPMLDIRLSLSAHCLSLLP